MASTMTPPDSGAPKKRTPEEWRKLADEERRGTEQGLAFLDAVERDGCMAKVKPDSGERWPGGVKPGFVKPDFGEREETIFLPSVLGHLPNSVLLSLPLAQRILAALESMQNHASGAEFRSLADELRARLPT